MLTLRRTAALLLSLFLASCLALLPAQGASAEEPMELAGLVTDTTNTLSDGDISEIEDASASLESATGSSLYVVIVSTFESPNVGNDWASAVALDSQLGVNDIILYIGTDAGEFGLNVDQSLSLSSADRESIQNDILPLVNQRDFVGASVQAASELEQALNGSYSGGSGNDTSGATSSSSESSSVFTIVLGVLVLVVLIVVAIVFLNGRRKRQKQLREAEQKQAAELEARLQQASIQLVRMDNLIKSSDEEVAFASAEFGAEEVKVYQNELGMAKKASKEAFELQGKLLDHIPDAPEDREAWIERILSITDTATKRLSDQASHFQELRVRQNDAPKLLVALRQRAEAARPRLTEISGWFDGLDSHYDQAARDRIGADISQARQLLELADDEIEGATASAEAGNAGAAIVDITDAENAFAQFDGLVKGLTATRELFERAPRQIADEAGQLKRTLAQVEDLTGTASVTPSATTAETVTEARKLLGDIDQAAGRFTDPAATIERLHAVAGRLDDALGGLLDAKERLDHARARLPEALRNASAEISAAAQFINSKRGAVSSGPRTRLDQAESQLARAEALRNDDPVQALQLANDADHLARTALSTGKQEVDNTYSFSSWDSTSHSSYGRHRSSYSGGGDQFLSSMGGAILGGIISGILSDSGSSRRHDNDWSGFGGFGGFGGGGGGGGFSGGGGSRGGFGGGGGTR
ncbi:TPM domain-containing protein [Gulosibacter sp. ACHW.36C]|uniref:TPM domain-containing protein n=1 Tax=Gulosibacter sediminis TaxID=1729695 RepID=A0ABY4N1K0_9MICO|nr:TPM domain-containing protein [Gulosibacter sediminis]UQN15899.1 TPM domain-containing protein [Gulosibacter sediminis]